MAFFLHLKNNALRFSCLALFLVILPPFIKTLSRASYLALAAMLISMLLLMRRKKLVFGMMLLGAALLFPLISPQLFTAMKERMQETFTVGHGSQFTSYRIGGQTISDQSALERIESWHYVVNNRVFRNPLTAAIGNGVTGIGFVEGQFFLVLGELGMIGVAAFYWLLFRIAREGYVIYRNASDPVPQSLSIALVCCLIGLVFQSLTTNTFIIVRIMEPFWFLTALVMITPLLFPEKGGGEIKTV
jgi:O-antigen ligase